MLIRQVLSGRDASRRLLPGKSSLQPIGPSSCTRHGWVRLPSIAQYSSLLPPVGVWSLSQYQCGGLSSQIPYPSSTWWAVTPPNYLMGRMPVLYRIASFHQPRMPSLDLIGYYFEFLRDIPVYRVGCIRVTHPCAGRRHSIATARCPSACMC